MTKLEPQGANAEQIEFWNGEAAKSWIEYQDRLDVLLRPLSQTVVARAALVPGESVLDVGCGCGATSLEFAARGARVVGIDVSGPMLDQARGRASSAGANAQFILADAATHRFAAEFDVLFSRFGVMFFADPVVAFRNLRSALKPDGRVAFLCWQSVKVNPWMAVPMGAARPHLPEQPAPVDPRAPGPFAFADTDYVRAILVQAGYRGVEIESVEADLELGSDVDEALAFVGRVGPLSRPLAQVDADVRKRALLAVRDALAPLGRDGPIKLGARCWLVTAAV